MCTSPRRSAASSSRTRPGTSSTRATWSPGASTASVVGDPDRRAQRPGRADAPPLLHLRAAAHPDGRGVRQQDGPGRLRAVALRRHRRARSARWPRRCSRPTRCCTSCRCRRCTARTSPRRRRISAGTPGRRCSTCSRPPIPTSAPRCRAACRCSACCGRAMRRAIDVRAYAGRVASGTFAVGDDIVVQPGERRSRIASLTHHGRGRHAVPRPATR